VKERVICDWAILSCCLAAGCWVASHSLARVTGGFMIYGTDDDDDDEGEVYDVAELGGPHNVLGFLFIIIVEHA
jgi:hypothetical protein